MIASEYIPLDIPGWMTVDECRWLYDLGKTYRTIVEVGSWQGKSTHAILSGNYDAFGDNRRSRRSGQVVAVDHFQGSPSELDSAHVEAKLKGSDYIYNAFIRNVCEFGNLLVIRKESVDASIVARNLFLEGVDCVFIDGEHTKQSVMRDLIAWSPLANKMICGHDLNMQGVRDGLDEIYGRDGYKSTRVGSLWVREL